jgi:hypothetical protein
MTDTPREPTILDRLRPVGSPPDVVRQEPPALAALSTGEHRRRSKRSKAQRSATGESPQAGSGKPRSVSTRTPLTHGEALELVSDVARQSYATATSGSESANARKNAAVGLAVSVDKFIALTQRPAPPTTPSTDRDLAAQLSLARKLLGCPSCRW